MRILIISDSHKNTGKIEKIIRSQSTAKHIFFLGDCTGDIDDLQYEFSDRIFHIVSGNCDFFSEYKSVDIAIIGGKKILYTHGHTFGVKHGTENLIKAAREINCDIALYGHTHISDILYEDGLYIVNPGSCSEGRNGNSYAIIDIEENGIMPVIVDIR